MNYEIIDHPKYKYRLVDSIEHELLVKLPYSHLLYTPYISINDGCITIKEGYAWDGPSGPTIDTTDFLKGSLIHDALYQLMREKYLPGHYRKLADKELEKICIKQGMPKWRVWYVYYGVRWFGWYAVR